MAAEEIEAEEAIENGGAQFRKRDGRIILNAAESLNRQLQLIEYNFAATAGVEEKFIGDRSIRRPLRGPCIRRRCEMGGATS